MTKFNWIKTQTEYKNLIAFLDREVSEMQCSVYPDAVAAETVYCNLINDRDELLDHAITMGFND